MSAVCNAAASANDNGSGRWPGSYSALPVKKPCIMASAEHKKLSVFIGKWHTTGEVAATLSTPAARVNFTDTYRWYPGEFFLVHDAEGTVGDEYSYSLEIIGYDAEQACYVATFFDSSGGSGTETIQLEGNTWTWRGSNVMGVKEHRCMAVVSEDEKTIQARHEKSEDGVHWELWMDVTLEKLEA